MKPNRPNRTRGASIRFRGTNILFPCYPTGATLSPTTLSLNFSYISLFLYFIILIFFQKSKIAFLLFFFVTIAVCLLVASLTRLGTPGRARAAVTLCEMATMESLIGLVNRIQRACTVLGDYGGDSALPTLWEALPSVVVVGGQVFSSSMSVLYTK